MRLLIAIIVFMVFLALSAKVVRNEAPAQGAGKDEIKVYFSADKFDAAGYVNTIWDSKVVPYVKEKAVDFPVIVEAVKKGGEAAGKQYGYRAVAEQNPYNFAVKGKVKILSANVQSRNGRLEADVAPFDGTPDITIQVGPVFKGTSLRDLLNFVTFDDFKNQVEFAKLATQLNQTAGEKAVVPLDILKDGGVGKIFELYGATTLEGGNTHFNVVPVALTPAAE